MSSTPATIAPTSNPVLMLPADAPPQILEVRIASEVSPGQMVTGSVVASSNVASVEVRVSTYSMAMTKVGVGCFMLTASVPRLPFFLRNQTYTVLVIARNTRGDAVTQTLRVTVH